MPDIPLHGIYARYAGLACICLQRAEGAFVRFYRADFKPPAAACEQNRDKPASRAEVAEPAGLVMDCLRGEIRERKAVRAGRGDTGGICVF